MVRAFSVHEPGQKSLQQSVSLRGRREADTDAIIKLSKMEERRLGEPRGDTYALVAFSVHIFVHSAVALHAVVPEGSLEDVSRLEAINPAAAHLTRIKLSLVSSSGKWLVAN
jgi:hypothetical protein